MKILLAMIMAMSVSGAMAGKDKKNWDKLPFEEQKKMKLEKLDKKSAMIQETRSCINSASDKKGLQDCYKDMKSAKKDMKKEWKNKKKQAQEEMNQEEE